MGTGVKGIRQVGITVPSIEEGMRFYRDLLGFEQELRADWPSGPGELEVSNEEGLDQMRRTQEFAAGEELEGSIVFLRSGDFTLKLFEFRKPKSPPVGGRRHVIDPGLMQIVIEVDDLDRLYERLLAADVEFHAPPQALDFAKFTYARDPFGNIIEFFEVLKEMPGL